MIPNLGFTDSIFKTECIWYMTSSTSNCIQNAIFCPYLQKVIVGPVCHSRAGCDHHFFGNAMATPAIFMSLGTLIPNLTSKISNSKEN